MGYRYVQHNLEILNSDPLKRKMNCPYLIVSICLGKSIRMNRANSLRLNTANVRLICYRWLCYCHVPAFCDSLPRYETTLIFGRTLLRSVFQIMRKQLLDKFRAEKDRMPAEKRTLVLTHFPRLVCQCFISLTLYLLVSSADNLCIQIGPRSGPT